MTRINQSRVLHAGDPGNPCFSFLKGGGQGRSAWRAIGWRVIPPTLLIIGIALWLLLASPPLDRAFRELQACPVHDISEVRVYDVHSLTSGSPPRLVLRGKGVAAFMGLISRAKRTNPNHPRGGPTLFAEVYTTRWGTRHLRISATDNCGVLIYISSNKLGNGSSWEAGPWRNDGLQSLVFGWGEDEPFTSRRSE